MGEATYYMKLEFRTSNQARLALGEIRDFLREGSEAYEYWQSNRGSKEPAKFWAQFATRFPRVKEYLGKKFGKDHNNDLAGTLDFGNEDDIENNLMSEGKFVKYNAYVWHFADWDPIVAFCKKKYGALKGGYVSDEYANVGELVVLK